MTFSLSYESTAVPDFEWLAEQVARPEPLLQAFASYRRSQFAQTIGTGRDPYGAAFAPLSAMYAVQKAKKVGSKAVLTRTGAMLRSYKVVVSGNKIEESVSADPAQFHQQGTSKMAQRLLLPDERGLPAKDQQKLLELVDRFLEESVIKMPKI